MAAETHTDRKSQYHVTVPGELGPKAASLLELGDGGVQGGQHSKRNTWGGKKKLFYCCEKRSLGKPAIYRHVMQKERTGKESTLGILETSQVKHMKGKIPRSCTLYCINWSRPVAGAFTRTAFSGKIM